MTVAEQIADYLAARGCCIPPVSSGASMNMAKNVVALTNLDGGDLQHSLQKHRNRRRWLRQAEEWITSDRSVVVLSSGDIDYDEIGFRFDISRDIWEPQLREQMDKVKKELDELDRIVRSYVESALNL